MADLDLARYMAPQFQLPAPLLSAELYPGGHINDSYRITTKQADGPRFLLQRLNADVFPRPDWIMDNIRRISHHAAEKRNGHSKPGQSSFLNLVPTVSDEPFMHCPNRDVWRLYEFIEGAMMRESAATPEEAEQAGVAFGEFQVMLSDLPGPALHEIIKDFHHTPKRLRNLEDAAQSDSHSRADGVQPELEFVRRFAPEGSLIIDGMQSGRIANRPVHNDAKMSNVLLDAESGKRLCVIDLDTAMPGSVLYDFGDMMRTMLCTAPEDETDLSKVRVELSMFEAVANGYMRGAMPILNQDEQELLVFSGIMITMETGSRFLADHLKGDHYFRIHRPNQNLDRARCQFQLAQSMIDHRSKMEQLLATCAH
jgi:aminoglycoside phosphotransferase (APT) family kinase protein